jgi:hypothetical protein
MKIKESSGWSVTSGCMLEAAFLLSDGAFKLFVYICLTADRETGRLRVAQGELARALGKSRGSISSYLEELSQKGACLVRPAPNQHQTGEIEVADAFWPYYKQSAQSTNAERDYMDQIRSWLLQYPIIRSSFGAADRKLAAEFFRKGIALEQIEKALLLGVSRKFMAALNSTAPAPIYSLSYFAELLEEVAQTEVADSYWEYLRRRVKDFNDAWQDRLASPHRRTTLRRNDIGGGRR